MTPSRRNPRPLAELEAQLRAGFAAPNGPSLAEVADVVAGLADAPPEPGRIQADLDRLAEGAPAICADAETVLDYVFVDLGFKGNHREYFSPDNSYLHRVLETRLGIPITLAVVAIEVGRRLGIALTPVGFPGHFLLGDGARNDRWFDPFEAGRALDVAGCQDLLARAHPGARLEPSHTAVLGAGEVAHRMLNNLRHIHLTMGDLSRATAVAQLSVALPGSGVAHRIELIKLLNATGRFDAAAEQHEVLALLDTEHEAQHHAAATRLRSHLN